LAYPHPTMGLFPGPRPSAKVGSCVPASPCSASSCSWSCLASACPVPSARPGRTPCRPAVTRRRSTVPVMHRTRRPRPNQAVDQRVRCPPGPPPARRSRARRGPTERPRRHPPRRRLPVSHGPGRPPARRRHHHHRSDRPRWSRPRRPHHRHHRLRLLHPRRHWPVRSSRPATCGTAAWTGCRWPPTRPPW
jgi:hypothetical protein